MPCRYVRCARSRSGGRGRCRFSPPPPPLLSLPRILAVLVAGCPVWVSLVMPAHTPLHVVCAFRELGPVALSVRAACSLCVCVPTHPQRSRLPPSRCRLARALREVRSQVAGRAVPGVLCPTAFLARVPCSACRWWGWVGGGPRVSRRVPRWCCGVSGVGHSPSPDRPSYGQAAGARSPCFLGRSVCGHGGPSQHHMA